MGPKQGEIVRASPDASQAYAQRQRDIPEIRRDIEKTRGRLDETIDAIRGRLTPQSIGRQAMSVIRYRSKVAGRRMTDMLAENPLPMALTSVGATWLLGQTIRRRRARKAGEREIELEFQEDQPLAVQRNLYDAGLEAQYEVREHEPGEGVRQPGVGEQAQQAGREYAEQAREKAGEYGEAAREKVSEYGQRVGEAGRRVGEQASDIGHRVSDSAQRASQFTFDAVKRHPITAALGLMAAGLAVGLALPATRKERELVGEQRDELFERAREYGGELAERGQAVAQQAGEAASEEAEHQGVTPEQLKAEAEQAGRELTEEGDEGESGGEPPRS